MFLTSVEAQSFPPSFSLPVQESHLWPEVRIHRLHLLHAPSHNRTCLSCKRCGSIAYTPSLAPSLPELHPRTRLHLDFTSTSPRLPPTKPSSLAAPTAAIRCRRRRESLPWQHKRVLSSSFLPLHKHHTLRSLQFSTTPLISKRRS